MKNDNLVKEFYDNYAEEERLLGPTGNIEFQTTIMVINEEIEKIAAKKNGSPVTILDACAGTGAYSLYYANRPGISVTATDLSKTNLDKLLDATISNITITTDITVLPPIDVLSLKESLIQQEETEKYDIVLLMGALYHISDYNTRLQAIEQAKSVLNPDGILVTTHCMRYPTCFAVLVEAPEEIQMLPEFIDTGIVPDSIEGLHPFYSEKSIDTLQQHYADTNLTITRIFSQDGVNKSLTTYINKLSAKDYQIFLDLHLKVCEDPYILGSSAHVAVISKFNH